MIGIVYSKLDETGANMADRLLKTQDFVHAGGQPCLKYENDVARMFEIDVWPFQAEVADSFGCDTLVFMSRHKSEAEVDAFTTHSLGNWRNGADVGGAARQLSFAAPVLMLKMLENLSKIEEEVQKTYEATHHGPLLKTPSLFIELGGGEKMMFNKAAAAKVADAAFAAVTSSAREEIEFEKIAVGIGGGHYPEKFSKLALEKRYAFSHIMPKYVLINDDGSDNLDMLEQAATRSANKPELAVIDWKSLNSVMKEKTTTKLEEIGLDYERV